MINGVHVVVYSKDPEADRAFFRDVKVSDVSEQRWGKLATLPFPGAAKSAFTSRNIRVH